MYIVVHMMKIVRSEKAAISTYQYRSGLLLYFHSKLCLDAVISPEQAVVPCTWSFVEFESAVKVA